MQTIYHKVLNANRMVDRRKDLRSKSTPAESILWQELRNNKLGLRFKPKAKLVVEIDGGVHRTLDSQKYDKYRTEYLKSLGITEMRFKNEQVISYISNVISEIKNKLPSPEVRRGMKG